MASSPVQSPHTMNLPFAPQSVSVARQRLKSFMTEKGDDQESIEDARVVISELVANSVRHAQPLVDGSILVTWTVCPEGIEVAVTDGGSGTRPRNVHAPSSALAGRGMAIVETLAQRWWAERSGSRSTVHAVVRG